MSSMPSNAIKVDKVKTVYLCMWFKFRLGLGKDRVFKHNEKFMAFHLTSEEGKCRLKLDDGDVRLNITLRASYTKIYSFTTSPNSQRGSVATPNFGKIRVWCFAYEERSLPGEEGRVTTLNRKQITGAIAQYQITPLLFKVYSTPPHESRDPNQPIKATQFMFPLSAFIRVHILPSVLRMHRGSFAGFTTRVSSVHGSLAVCLENPNKGTETENTTRTVRTAPLYNLFVDSFVERVYRYIITECDFSGGNPEPSSLFRCNANATKISDWLIWGDHILYYYTSYHTTSNVYVHYNYVSANHKKRKSELLANAISSQKDRVQRDGPPKYLRYFLLYKNTSKDEDAILEK
ncbi:hypothetical protein WN51_06204 [Melipona quadrifasciata]|uniref:Uncharacterized protein n=1 Tax=Melipona quadrifasciata TaxID=166423 RepID=A0A0M8ZUM6_9HYME|nr:hypothetical protein WN51_06204 [Melipona quadrifasciata]